jgi:hypothetical protein
MEDEAWKEQICRDLRDLQEALRGNIGTPKGWDRPVEPLVAGTYNDILARAQERGHRTAREIDDIAIPPSYRDLLTVIDLQLKFLECPEPPFRVVEPRLFDTY